MDTKRWGAPLETGAGSKCFFTHVVFIAAKKTSANGYPNVPYAAAPCLPPMHPHASCKKSGTAGAPLREVIRVAGTLSEQTTMTMTPLIIE